MKTQKLYGGLAPAIVATSSAKDRSILEGTHNRSILNGRAGSAEGGNGNLGPEQNRQRQ